MHRKRGFKCCGYHYYVRTDGEICTMRPVERAGAHARGYRRSIGIAYEGGLDERTAADTRTELQKRSLRILVRVLKADFPGITQVVGHRDLSPDLDGDGVVERMGGRGVSLLLVKRALTPVFLYTPGSDSVADMK